MDLNHVGTVKAIGSVCIRNTVACSMLWDKTDK